MNFRILLVCANLLLVSLVPVSLGSASAQEQPPQAPASTQSMLEKTISVELLDTPLGTALERIQRESGVNYVIDPSHAGSIEDNPVTLRLQQTSISDALDLICLTADADWDLVNGVVFVSTPQVMRARRTVTKMYDIRGLLVAVQNQVGPSLDSDYALSNTNSGGSTMRLSASGDQADKKKTSGSSLFGDSDDSAEAMISREERILQIMELIQETVGKPDYWLDLDFSLREIGGTLVVKCTPECHEQIDEMLGSLQEQAGKMVQVQGQYFIMPRKVLEEVLEGNAGSLVVAPDRLAKVTGRLTEGASTRLAATRNIGFNGQRVFLYAGRDKQFISDFEPVPDASGFDITLSTLRDGVVLDVLPTLIRGGQEVVVAIKSDLVAGVEAEPVAWAGDSTEQASPLPSGLALPRRDQLNYRTTVRVPVGGAVLLTGSSGLLSSVDANDSEVVLLMQVDAMQ